MIQTNKKIIFGILLATIVATSLIAPRGSGVSFALMDKTLDHLHGIDKSEIIEITATSDITTTSDNPNVLVGFGSSGSDSSGSDSESSDSSSGEDNDVPDGGTANGQCGADLPKVDVRATHIGGILSFAPIWHLFVIYADCSGIEYFYRGGPSEEGGGGTIKGTSDQYKSGTVDWDPEAPSVTVGKGSSALGKDACFQSELSRIESKAIPYEAMGPNSNTAAKTLIANCGFTPEKPVNAAPGWGDPKL
jgi:hypothetical protein